MVYLRTERVAVGLMNVVNANQDILYGVVHVYQHVLMANTVIHWVVVRCAQGQWLVATHIWNQVLVQRLVVLRILPKSQNKKQQIWIELLVVMLHYLANVNLGMRYGIADANQNVQTVNIVMILGCASHVMVMLKVVVVLWNQMRAE